MQLNDIHNVQCNALKNKAAFIIRFVIVTHYLPHMAIFCLVHVYVGPRCVCGYK